MKRDRFLQKSFGALGATSLIFPFAGPAAAADTFTLRMSLPTPATTAWNIAFAQMASAVNRRSEGRLKIEIFPSSQLAKQQESVTGLVSGSVDLTMQTSVFLDAYD